MIIGDLTYEPTEPTTSSVLLSEMDLTHVYEQTLVRVREVFENGGTEAEFAVEMLAPYLNASEELSSCTPMQAQIIYSQISKGYSLVANLCGKAEFDRNVAISDYKSIKAMYYLEKFAGYLAEQKAKGLSVKDTDASREHYLNMQEAVIQAKMKVDFYDALVTTISGWRSKLYSDMGHAKNSAYARRYTDSLSGMAN
jgi:hypothetical protein